MTADEALQVAVEAGWPWHEPIQVGKKRLFFIFGPATWHVMSNAVCRGMNVNVHIDDQTGRVISKGFAPR
ncbi:MAG: hypothetical protein JWP89_1742 [Schlesneria sp.]|nr:hypothetical protein [Schlesneria sp.]